VGLRTEREEGRGKEREEWNKKGGGEGVTLASTIPQREKKRKRKSKT